MIQTTTLSFRVPTASKCLLGSTNSSSSSTTTANILPKKSEIHECKKPKNPQTLRTTMLFAAFASINKYNEGAKRSKPTTINPNFNWLTQNCTLQNLWLIILFERETMFVKLLLICPPRLLFLFEISCVQHDYYKNRPFRRKRKDHTKNINNYDCFSFLEAIFHKDQLEGEIIVHEEKH